MDADVPDPVRTAWDAAVARWDEPAAHDALLAAAAQHGSFGWACARYRERAGDPVAARQLERMQRAALATMYASAATRPERDAQPMRGPLVLIALLVVALCVGLAIVAVLHGRHASHGQQPPPKPPKIAAPR